MNSIFSVNLPWVGDPTVNTIATVVGVIAVALVVASYAMKSRLTIVITGAIARLLFVAQYALLGKLEGMAMNLVVVICFELARRRDTMSKPCQIAAYAFSNAITLAAGILTYVSPISILPMLGLLFNVNGAWCKKELYVRLVSLPGCPMWFTYNLLSGVYASCVGDVLSFAILLASLIKYDVLDKRKRKA